MSNFKSYHVGGGGNCVFFSAASQLSENIHQGIRDQLSAMRSDPAKNEQLRASAKKMIDLQFKAGIINTSLNPELHDYNYKGANATDNILDRITKTSGDDMNNVLALRLMMDVSCPQEEYGNPKYYLGKSDGDIYAGLMGDFPKDLAHTVSLVSDKKAPAPSVFAISQNGDRFMASYASPDGKLINKQISDKEPNETDIANFFKENDINDNNMIGLKGKDKHCKAFVDTEKSQEDMSDNLAPVTEERRGSSRGIRGFFQNIYNRIKNFVTGGPKPVSEETGKEKPTKTSKEAKENGGKDKSKSVERELDKSIDSVMVMDDAEIDDDEPTVESVDKSASEKSKDIQKMDFNGLVAEHGLGKREQMTAAVSENTQQMSKDMGM